MHLHGNWLPGDPRGFRSRDHRIHSSGDYKHKPPTGEHADLHAYQRRTSAPAVVLSRPHRQVIGRLLLEMVTEDHNLLVISTGATHVHMQVGLPEDLGLVRKLIGNWRQRSSRALVNEVPSRMWAKGGKPIPVHDRPHQRSLYKYICGHISEGAWVWNYRDGELAPT
jgi:hypothetical protein